MHDNYKLVTGHGKQIAPCPVCSAAGEVWRYSESPSSPTATAVMCARGEAFGPQEPGVHEGCVLFMPPQEFYKATIREAVNYWNEYAEAVRQLRGED
jgi:hypothetical protein